LWLVIFAGCTSLLGKLAYEALRRKPAIDAPVAAEATTPAAGSLAADPSSPVEPDPLEAQASPRSGWKVNRR
jgi:hypothetical protein